MFQLGMIPDKLKKMRKVIKILLLLILVFFSANYVLAQENDTIWTTKYDTITKKIRELESIIPGLNEKISNSVTGVTIDEFIRAIAISSGVNISIDPNLKFQIINNFNNVKVSDVLLFLCNQYRFDITSIGTIIIIRQIEKPLIPNRCIIQYDTAQKYLSLDIEDVELGIVSQKITDVTMRNVLPGSGLFNEKVKIYIQKMPVQSALDKIAYSNNLILKSTEDGFFIFEKLPPEKKEITQQKTPSVGNTLRTEKEGTYKLTVSAMGNDSLLLLADKAPIAEIIKEVSDKSGNNYVMSSIPKGEISLHLNGVKYSDIIKTVLGGTDHFYKKQGKIYIIGNKSTPDLMCQALVQLQYRAVDSVLYLIPKDLTDDLDKKIFREQNSIMLSGPSNKVAETERFLHQIDRLVPVVSIEVMLIDYNASATISTGITAGLTNGDVPPTSGEVFPSVDLALNSQSINDLINRFNGFGWAKIGRVTPKFYANIKALENDGILNIRSTPILSTLNGHQTKLSIGKTEYYLEEQLNIIGTQNPQSTRIETYKPVDAELAVIITPIVSGDEQITLEVEVNQSDFTERISKNAPPGKVNRTFKSQIRVKNGEMILLGGLEENRNSQTASGIPLLSRVPILKWIFSSRTNEKSKSKLNIFIKPTIIS